MTKKLQPKKIMNSGFSDWSPEQLPDLKGKLYLITGGNSGIGFEAAKMLNSAGADITIACRNLDKGREAVEKLNAIEGTKIELIQLDLADLSSVRKAADEVRTRYSKIDGLINNAGIMATPQQQTADGFEMQLGTNHLGHFLWAGLLIDLVKAVKGRVVVVSSIIHKMGYIKFKDLMLINGYSPWKAYSQSKLATSVFAFELDRRLKAANSEVSCIGCHPGYSSTSLQTTGPTGFYKLTAPLMNGLMAQPSYRGAIPTVLAAAGKEAKAGGYYGPQSFFEMRGKISDAEVASLALDEKTGARLWEESEKLVGFKWPQL